MGKHKKHKKEKKHKDKKHKRRHSSSSSSEEEWVEKAQSSKESSPEPPREEKKPESTQRRDDWMSLAPTSFLTASNLDRRREREENKRLERERQQYNPSECARELNPYWKDGGDGLPSFKKPVDDDDHYGRARTQESSNSRKNDRYSSNIRGGEYRYDRPKGGNWRKQSSALNSKSPARNRGGSRERSPPGSRGESPSRESIYKSRGSPSRIRGRNSSESRGESPRNRGGSHRSRGSPSRNRGESIFKTRGSPSRSRTGNSPGSREESPRNRGGSPRNRGGSPRNRGGNPRSSGSPSRSRESPSGRDEGSSEPEEQEAQVLSDAELNVLASRLVKAEIMGNAQMINELKAKLEKARKLRESGLAPRGEEKVILTHTDSRGQARPVRLQSEYGGAPAGGSKKKKQKVETHRDGERMRYFADDDKYSLKQMFENEKYTSIEDQNSEFVKMASKIRKNDDMDEVFADNIRHKESDDKVDARNRDRAIDEHRKVSQSLDNCRKCLQSDVMPKHLMVSMHESVYLSLPPHEPLTDGHCSIAPIRHVPCATQLDENEWTDIMDVRKALVKQFAAKNEDVVFFETAMYLHRYPHMAIECVPLPREEGDMAPIYFKKAIDESETEWAQNKQLVSMKGKDVRKCIPKGLPYFAVSFGMEEGYAHVIEDQETFPENFAQEIIGGMLDLHHSKWRRPKNQSFEEQSKRVLQFSKEWSKYDCSATS